MSKARAQRKIARQTTAIVSSAKDQVENYVEEWQGYMSNELTKDAKSELSKLKEIHISVNNLITSLGDTASDFESENVKFQEEISELSKRRKLFHESSSALLKEFEEEKSSLIVGLKRKKTAAMSHCKAMIGEMVMSPGRAMVGAGKALQKTSSAAKRIRAL